jgi:hypothetical protein
MSDERIPVGWHADGTPAYLPDDLAERHDSGPWLVPMKSGRGKSWRPGTRGVATYYDGKDGTARLFHVRPARTRQEIDDEAVRAFLKARSIAVPVTVRVIHYRESDCYRVVALNADGNEIDLIGIYTEGGEDGYWRAEQAADLAGFERLLPISRIDVP